MNRPGWKIILSLPILECGNAGDEERELYPHYGQGSDIRDEFGNELEFPAGNSLDTHILY